MLGGKKKNQQNSIYQWLYIKLVAKATFYLNIWSLQLQVYDGI